MALTAIHRRLLAILRAHPDGIEIGEIRKELGLRGDEQQHLDRRIRDLRAAYDLPHLQGRGYVLGAKQDAPADLDPLDAPLRARILNRDHGRCQMCGRTVAEDRVKLQVDHPIPREWGGPTQEWNLQALCAEWNQGKRDYFASFDPKLMTAVKNEPRVHVRLGETLRLAGGQGASADLLAFVADQREWAALALNVVLCSSMRTMDFCSWRFRVTPWVPRTNS